jgi:hypothetical protein
LLVKKKNCHSSYLCLVWWKCSTLYFAEVTCSANIAVVGASFTVPPDPKEGDIVVYQCVAGFESSSGSGRGSIVCQENGKWSAPSDPCQSKSNTYNQNCPYGHLY